jgi:hypothetical protein
MSNSYTIYDSRYSPDSKEIYKSSSPHIALTGRVRGTGIAAPNDLFISLEHSMQPDVLISEDEFFSLVDQESQRCGWQKKLFKAINKLEKREATNLVQKNC